MAIQLKRSFAYLKEERRRQQGSTWTVQAVQGACGGLTSLERRPPGTREVSPRAVVGLIDAAAAVGLPALEPERIFGLSEETLRRTTRRFDWERYQRFLMQISELARQRQVQDALFEAHLRCYPELAALGAGFTDLPSLYRYIASGFAASMWANLRLDGESSADGRSFTVSCDGEPSLFVGPDFRRLLLTTLRKLPSLVGLPEAAVFEDARGDRHRFHATLPTRQLPTSPALTLESVRALVAALHREQAAVAEACRAPVTNPGDAGRKSLPTQLARARQSWGVTPRQGQVLELLTRGYTNKEIARTLECAVVTVENHVSALLRAAGARSRADLTARACQGDC